MEDASSCGYTDHSSFYVIIVFGASGDLAKRKTFPALQELFVTNLLSVSNCRIYGYARSAKPNFTQLLKAYLAAAKGSKSRDSIREFLSTIRYIQTSSYSDSVPIERVLKEYCSSRRRICFIFYLAIPPTVFLETCRAIHSALKRQSLKNTSTRTLRLVLEKPFGHDFASCSSLLRELTLLFPEEHMYRIDHYLFKQSLQHIQRCRLFEGWINWKPDCIHLLWKEDFGVNGRAYFDQVGIIRDVIQNHLLQLLVYVTMPLDSVRGDRTAAAIRGAKLALLRQIRPVNPNRAVLGQYIGYSLEPGEKKESHVESSGINLTPTYACVEICIDSPEWRNTRVVIEAGKALDRNLCEIRFIYRATRSFLVFRVQPEASIFAVTTNGLMGRNTTVTPLTPPEETLQTGALSLVPTQPYSRLLHDVIKGDERRFVGGEELLESWRIVDPLLHATLPVQRYKQGSRGPDNRLGFLRSCGVLTPDDMERSHPLSSL